MKLCPKCEPEVGPVCDFCKHFDFNGDATGAYTGDGWCRLHKEPRDPASGCDDFHCRDADAADQYVAQANGTGS